MISIVARLTTHALLLLLAFAGFGRVNGASPEEIIKAALERKQPNILLILADDLGYGDLGCYGQSRIKTPNIDRLAAEGTRYTQAYAGSTVCAPSRAVLMTGFHTGHNRIRGNDQRPLLSTDVTVARLLDKAGYQTALFGKWSLGLPGSSGIPTRQGFQEWLGYLDQTAAHNYYPTQLYRNDQVMDLPQNEGGRHGLYVQDLIDRVTTNYLRTAKYRPFFLCLAYTLPHANNELGRATGNGMETPSDAPYSKEPWPQPEKNKAAMITRIDSDVGMVLAALKAHRMTSNTVVIFTSDNGPHSEGGVKASFHQSSGPLRGIKRDLYEGGIRVPLIAWWPGRIPAGRVSQELFPAWDFLPTALDLAGLPIPAGLDGISMKRDLLGLAQTNRHETLYWEFHEGWSRQAIRMGNWKGVRNGVGEGMELYDLATDLGETNNLASAHPEILARLEERLAHARNADPEWPLKPKPAPGEPADPKK